MQSKELNKMVKDSKTLPLIAELHHLYGVEVIRPLGLQIVYDERNYEDKPAYYYEKIHNPNSSKWKDLEEQEQCFGTHYTIGRRDENMIPLMSSFQMTKEGM